MSSNNVRAAIDASNLKKAILLLQENPELVGTPVRTINSMYDTPLSYLLYKLSSGTFKFGGIFGKDLIPLQTILKIFKDQGIQPSPNQDVSTICKRISDKDVLKVIRQFYNTNCNVQSPYQSPYPPQGYPQRSYPPQSHYPYPPQGYPQSPPPTPVYPRSPYSPQQGYPPVYTGRAGVRSRTRYRKNRQRQTQKTQKTQKQKRKSNK